MGEDAPAFRAVNDPAGLGRTETAKQGLIHGQGGNVEVEFGNIQPLQQTPTRRPCPRGPDAESTPERRPLPWHPEGPQCPSRNQIPFRNHLRFPVRLRHFTQVPVHLAVDSFPLEHHKPDDTLRQTHSHETKAPTRRNLRVFCFVEAFKYELGGKLPLVTQPRLFLVVSAV